MKSKELNSILKERMIIVYKYLIKNGCDYNDAEDIVQDTFLKAIEFIDGISIDKINSWLFKVALNKFYDLCRKKSRHPEFDIEEDKFLNSLRSEFCCEEYILKTESIKEVSKVLSELTPLYRNLLILKYEMGLSYREIGEILEIKIETVKTYLYRARNSFKKNWEEFNSERV